MAEIREIYPDDVESILPVLAQFNDPFIGPEDWHYRISRTWGLDEPCGYALVDNGKPVGFLGSLSSTREIEGNTVRFCNLNSWIVHPDYRTHSLSMLSPILKLRDYLITDFTPSPDVYAISKKLGFRDLDTRAYFFPAIGLPKKSLDIELDPARIESRLDPLSLQRLQDHQDTAKHLLISDDEHACYVIFSVIKREFPQHCHLLYTNDRDALRHHLGPIVHQATRAHGCPGMLIDGRFLPSRPVWPLAIPVPVLKLCRGPKIEPPAIDNLYSELIFGNLSTLPHWRNLIPGAQSIWGDR